MRRSLRTARVLEADKCVLASMPIRRSPVSTGTGRPRRGAQARAPSAPEFQDLAIARWSRPRSIGEAAVAPASNVIPWPSTSPKQPGAVQSVLAAAPASLGAADNVRSFKGKRTATFRPVPDALAGLGMARRLNDGRYAA